MATENLYALWFQTSKRYLQSVTKRMEGYGLTLDSFRILELLQGNPDRTFTVQQLSSSLDIPSGSITNVTNRLLRKELITKRPCPTDKRWSFVEITKLGNRLITSLLEEHFSYLEESFSALDKQEKAQLVKMLQKMNQDPA
ncbi:MarR family transcriptional regulator [Chryseomicrobium sp. FSL W7-1435]|uniref:MarR family winged helix-turn-helix transcriptional regulator n=1 Tax=Chryseomicrobium sp. FSL W7-1435 TaxID=2921704 RepID=UPI00315A168A